MNFQQPPVLASSIPFLSLEAMVPLLEAGVGIEIFFDMPNWYDEIAIEDCLHSLRNSFGAFPLSFHASMADELDLSEPLGSPSQQRALAVFHRTIAMAGRVGAQYVVVHTHGHQRLIPDDIRSICQNRVKQSLRLLAYWAQQAGTKIVVENIGTESLGTLLFREQEYLKLFEEIPDIYSLVDVGHAFLNKWDIPALLRKLDSRVVALHVHDNRGYKDDHLPIGRGRIAWPTIADALIAMSNSPAVVLEYEKENGGSMLVTLLQGANIVGDWWKNTGYMENAV